MKLGISISCIHFILYWSIVDLQCVSFRYTAKYIMYLAFFNTAFFFPLINSEEWIIFNTAVEKCRVAS